MSTELRVSVYSQVPSEYFSIVRIRQYEDGKWLREHFSCEVAVGTECGDAVIAPRDKYDELAKVIETVEEGKELIFESSYSPGEIFFTVYNPTDQSTRLYINREEFDVFQEQFVDETE